MAKEGQRRSPWCGARLPPPGRSEDFGAAHSEECGILSGCENGRCVRVADGFICLCHQGYRLDPAQMACLGESMGEGGGLGGYRQGRLKKPHWPR